MSREALTVARARMTLGRLRSAEVPALAAEMLAAGVDSPSLRVLAGITQPVMSDVGPVFERAMRELGLAPLEKQQALRVLTCHYAEMIVSGAIEPYEGAVLIWNDLSHEYEPFEEVSIFVGLASQIDDYRQMALSKPDPYAGFVDACVQDIRVAAREYLAAAKTE
jgi:hypothetical protein